MCAPSLQDAEESNKADYLLPDREELERVTPKIEETLETMWDVEEKVSLMLWPPRAGGGAPMTGRESSSASSCSAPATASECA